MSDIVFTTDGWQWEHFLEKREGVALDNDHEFTTFVEYWRNGNLVHRSVHVTLKQGLDLGIGMGVVGG